MKDRRIFGLIGGLVMSVASANIYAEEPNANDFTIPAPDPIPYDCGDIHSGARGYGPFDYTNYEDFTTKLPLVEANHFTSDVEALIKGITDYVLFDIDYTLRVFPNHHRALASISKYEFVVPDAHEWLSGGRTIAIECYFVSAVKFKPTDGTVRLIYGSYLHRKGMVEARNELLKQAEIQYNAALKLLPNSAEAHYNLGLYYYDTNRLSQAVMHGHKAYELGFPLEGLKDMLIKRGVWDKTISQN